MAVRSINVLSLCCGIGGLKPWNLFAEPRAVCFVTWEAYTAATIVARVEDKTLVETLYRSPSWIYFKDGRCIQ